METLADRNDIILKGRELSWVLAFEISYILGGTGAVGRFADYSHSALCSFCLSNEKGLR